MTTPQPPKQGQLAGLSIPGFGDNGQRDISSVLEHLFENDDLSKVTEIPSNMIMHFIRLEIVKSLLLAVEEGTPFDPIGTFMQSYMKYMISRNRQGREEALKAAQAVRPEDRVAGDASL